MCGIAGEVDWRHGIDPAPVLKMAQEIAHRGPDDEGLWVEPGRRCVLAHRRLSIIDLSEAGHQPMVDPETGNSLVFNGEIYNYRDLRAQCEKQGDVFRSHSDTEVLLVLYRRYGENCLAMLRGMFAFVLWDARHDRLFLARDRVGKKPLNYALTETGLAFCSELHPLSRHPAVSRGMDVDALDLYLQLQSIPAPWTIYRQIRKLPPAHYAIFDNDGLRIERYWDIEYREKLKVGEDEALEEFERILTDAVRVRMIADVPLGALLSGGVDSSVVVALMAKLQGDPINTFTIGFDNQGFDEMPFAQQVADAYKTKHHSELVVGGVEDMLPQLARSYGEPYADSSAIPSFRVCQAARKHVKVVLNGDGGDELLGGYGRYAVRDHSVLTGKWLGEWLGASGITAMMPFWANASSTPARAVRRIARDFMSPEMGGLLMLTGYWNDSMRKKLLPRSAMDGQLIQDWRYGWLREAFTHADNPIDRMLWLDSHIYLPNDLLVKMDIASMHSGLEARSPFLDHELMEFCARLPVSMKVKGRVGKYLLKKLAEKYYPSDFVHRRKMGFAIPVAEWLRGPLKRHAEETLHDPELMAPLEMKHVRAAWKRLFEARGASLDAEAGRVWALLMYGQWRRLDA